jgi:hypothetical protein
MLGNIVKRQKMQRKIDEFYHMMPDDKAKIGASYCQDKSVHWDYFKTKDYDFTLDNPLIFKIELGKFSGMISDYQIDNCGFFLFSPRLRNVIDKNLTNIDLPKWFDAIVIDLDNNLLDYERSTFINKEKTHPIKKRFDVDKIGERLIFGSKYNTTIMIHDSVRKQVKKECSNIYFYGLEKPGRLV